MIEDIDGERAEWCAEFARLGRERVRYLITAGGMAGPRRKAEAAVEWLREQEAKAESRERWLFAIIIATLIFTFIGLVLMSP